MISDVLCEALDQIEEYQASFPDIYQGIRAEIEEVKLALARLLIHLDSPPEMTPERWADEMARFAESNPSSYNEVMKGYLYSVRREQVTEALGRDHPMLVRLLKAEEAGLGGASGLGEALDAYTDPTHPEYDPEFDRAIRSLRPDWFDDQERGTSSAPGAR